MGQALCLAKNPFGLFRQKMIETFFAAKAANSARLLRRSSSCILLTAVLP